MKTNRFNFAQLAASYGTPLYLYDMDQAVAHYLALSHHLPQSVSVYFCLKANNNRRIASIFRDHVAGADISSRGELALACDVGFDPGTLSFAGPGKSDSDLRCAINNGVGIVSIESQTELRRLSAIARELGTRTRVTIRVNPRAVPRAFAMKMGGRPSQFGVPEECLAPCVALAKTDRWVELAGIHVFSGTQCLDLPSIIANVEQTLALSARVSEEHDVPLELINLGGGFGVPYFPGHEAIDVDQLSRQLAQTIEAFVAAEPRFQDARYILELGRYLIGPFGIYVSRVVDVKTSRGQTFAVLDGGMHHCFAATGNFGQLVKKNYPVLNLSRPDGELRRYELVGPLCTPLDSMARDIELPEIRVGDLIGFDSCGAYGYSASPLLFLAHDTPAEVVFFESQPTLARPRTPSTSLPLNDRR